MKYTLLILSICAAGFSANAQSNARLAAKPVFSNTSAQVTEAVDANASLDVQAVERIAAANVVARSGAAVYTAGKAITLLPGFEAKAGSVFAATIAPVSARSAERTADLTVSAWPNPFQDLTTVEYSLPENTTVKHTLTDARGSVLRQRDSDGVQASGTYKIGVEGTSLPTGVYLYQVQTGNQTKTIRLLKQ